MYKFAGFSIMLVLIWIYYMHFYKPNTPEIFVDNIINEKTIKTGDLILFKAYNNIFPILHGCYFGHIGVAYILNGETMIFEANGIENVPLLKHHSKRGIFLTPLKERVKKYKGFCYLKPLREPVSDIQIKEFDNFVKYALNNFYYDYNIVSSALKRWFGYERCGKNTDCGQLAFLSLIKLGLLPIESYDQRILHYLKYVCNLEKVENNEFMPPIRMIDHPFAY